jgi:hypothetical protein
MGKRAPIPHLSTGFGYEEGEQQLQKKTAGESCQRPNCLLRLQAHFQ